MNSQILIVDDEESIRVLLKDILEDEGFRVLSAAHSEEAEYLLNKAGKDVQLCVLDIWLENSEKDGIELLETIKKNNPDLPVLMISGHGNVETAVQAIKKGAYDFIEKPFKTDRLLLTLNRAIEAAELRRENKALKHGKHKNNTSLIAKSNAMIHLESSIKRIAPTDSRVLITGEAGTGKDLLARLIHFSSKRKNKPYLALNCATLAPDRLEAELFGEITKDDLHIPGLLEQANHGTLFLDQIADMPLETQNKIVRVLQDQQFRPVGGTKEITVDVRIIAASNKDLSKLIYQGTFREDLYYRLNVMPITMPSLSERVEDIPELAQLFISKSAESEGLKPKKLDEALINKLRHTHWPGNVRQLKNVIEWMLIMHSSDEKDTLTLEHLPPEMSDGKQGTASNVTPIIDKQQAKIMALPLREARNAFEKEYLASQMVKFNGNISKTADFIGMERSALHRKLKSLGLDQDKNLVETINVEKTQSGV